MSRKQERQERIKQKRIELEAERKRLLSFDDKQALELSTDEQYQRICFLREILADDVLKNRVWEAEVKPIAKRYNNLKV